MRFKNKKIIAWLLSAAMVLTNFSPVFSYTYTDFILEKTDLEERVINKNIVVNPIKDNENTVVVNGNSGEKIFLKVKSGENVSLIENFIDNKDNTYTFNLKENLKAGDEVTAILVKTKKANEEQLENPNTLPVEENSFQEGGGSNLNNKEEVKEESKEEVKGESKEEVKEESKEEVKEESKEGSKEEVKEGSKEEVKGESKEEGKGESKEEVKEENKEEVKEENKEEGKGESTETNEESQPLIEEQPSKISVALNKVVGDALDTSLNKGEEENLESISSLKIESKEDLEIEESEPVIVAANLEIVTPKEGDNFIKVKAAENLNIILIVNTEREKFAVPMTYDKENKVYSAGFHSVLKPGTAVLAIATKEKIENPEEKTYKDVEDLLLGISVVDFIPNSNIFGLVGPFILGVNITPEQVTATWEDMKNRKLYSKEMNVEMDMDNAFGEAVIKDNVLTFPNFDSSKIVFKRLDGEKSDKTVSDIQSIVIEVENGVLYYNDAPLPRDWKVIPNKDLVSNSETANGKPLEVAMFLRNVTNKDSTPGIFTESTFNNFFRSLKFNANHLDKNTGNSDNLVDFKSMKINVTFDFNINHIPADIIGNIGIYKEVTTDDEEFKGTEHYYMLVKQPQPWMRAYNFSKQYRLLGLNGYLATVTSQGEYDFIEKNINPQEALIGASNLLNTTLKNYSENKEIEKILGDRIYLVNCSSGNDKPKYVQNNNGKGQIKKNKLEEIRKKLIEDNPGIDTRKDALGRPILEEVDADGYKTMLGHENWPSRVPMFRNYDTALGDYGTGQWKPFQSTSKINSKPFFYNYGLNPGVKESDYPGKSTNYPFFQADNVYKMSSRKPSNINEEIERNLIISDENGERLKPFWTEIRDENFLLDVYGLNYSAGQNFDVTVKNLNDLANENNSTVDSLNDLANEHKWDPYMYKPGYWNIDTTNDNLFDISNKYSDKNKKVIPYDLKKGIEDVDGNSILKVTDNPGVIDYFYKTFHQKGSNGDVNDPLETGTYYYWACGPESLNEDPKVRYLWGNIVTENFQYYNTSQENGSRDGVSYRVGSPIFSENKIYEKFFDPWQPTNAVNDKLQNDKYHWLNWNTVENIGSEDVLAWKYNEKKHTWEKNEIESEGDYGVYPYIYTEPETTDKKGWNDTLYNFPLPYIVEFSNYLGGADDKTSGSQVTTWTFEHENPKVYLVNENTIEIQTKKGEVYNLVDKDGNIIGTDIIGNGELKEINNLDNGKEYFVVLTKSEKPIPKESFEVLKDGNKIYLAKTNKYNPDTKECDYGKGTPLVPYSKVKMKPNILIPPEIFSTYEKGYSNIKSPNFKVKIGDKGDPYKIEILGKNKEHIVTASKVSDTKWETDSEKIKVSFANNIFYFTTEDFVKEDVFIAKEYARDDETTFYRSSEDSVKNQFLQYDTISPLGIIIDVEPENGVEAINFKIQSDEIEKIKEQLKSDNKFKGNESYILDVRTNVKVDNSIVTNDKYNNENFKDKYNFTLKLSGGDIILDSKTLNNNPINDNRISFKNNTITIKFKDKIKNNIHMTAKLIDQHENSSEIVAYPPMTPVAHLDDLNPFEIEAEREKIFKSVPEALKGGNIDKIVVLHKNKTESGKIEANDENRIDVYSENGEKLYGVPLRMLFYPMVKPEIKYASNEDPSEGIVVLGKTIDPNADEFEFMAFNDESMKPVKPYLKIKRSRIPLGVSPTGNGFFDTETRWEYSFVEKKYEKHFKLVFNSDGGFTLVPISEEGKEEVLKNYQEINSSISNTKSTLESNKIEYDMVINSPIKVLVKDKNNLTQEEKLKVKKEIENANPKLKGKLKITVYDNGEADVVFIYNSEIKHHFTQDETVYEKNTGNTTSTSGGSSGGGGSSSEGSSTKKDMGKYNSDKDSIIYSYPFYKYLDHEDFHIHYIYGYPDNYVRPERPILRCEAAAMVARLKGINREDLSFPNYKDTKVKAWFNGDINGVTKYGYMEGYPDGRFGPYDKMTRAEFAVLVANIDKDNKGESNFKDYIPSWAKEAVDKEYGNGRINGYPDGTFRPYSYVSRVEAAKVLNNIFNRGVDEEGLKGVYKDIHQFIDLQDKDYWGYYIMVEASNAHIYKYENDKEQETWKTIVKEYEQQ